MSKEKQTLNEIWKEQRDTKDAVIALTKALKDRPINLTIPGMMELQVPDTIVVEDLQTEVFEALKRVTMNTKGEVVIKNDLKIANFPELQKIVGSVDAEIKEPEALGLIIATELAKIMPVPKDFPKSFDIKKLEGKVEVFGKALVKIEGNEAKNPVFVQLSNGKREIDIEQLLKDIAQASGVKVVGGGLGGGVPSNPSAATTDQVGDATTATEIVPANSARREVIIVNDSSAVMYVKFGTGASASDYTARLEQYGYVQTEYTGVITALWASDAGGDCKVTEVI